MTVKFNPPKYKFLDLAVTPEPVNPWEPPAGIPMLHFTYLDKDYGVCTRPRAYDETGHYILRPSKISLEDAFRWNSEALAILWPAGHPGTSYAMIVTTPEALELVKTQFIEYKPG